MNKLNNRILIIAVFIIGLFLGSIISINIYKIFEGNPLDHLYTLYNTKGVSQEELARVDIERQVDKSLVFNDNILNRWKQYFDKILFEDIQLRKYAVSIVENCSSGDRECQTIEIYSYVVKHYKYYDDPRFRDFIQSTEETIQLEGGDCEDLTILLNSLLENIGIKTYMVVTENHVYSLACNLNKQKLSNEILDKTRFMKWYNISNEQCVVLDASAGQMSYVGNEPYIDGNKIAIDSVSNEYFLLDD